MDGGLHLVQAAAVVARLVGERIDAVEPGRRSVGETTAADQLQAAVRGPESSEAVEALRSFINTPTIAAVTSGWP